MRSLLVTILSLPMLLGWLLPVGAAPITATVCLNNSSGFAIEGAEALFNFGGWQSIGFTDATGCVSTDSVSAAGNRTFRIAYRGLVLNKTQNTLINPVVVFQTTAVNIRLVDSTGTTGISGAVIQYNAGGWQTLGTTDATGTVIAELLGVNTNFRVTHAGQTQTKSQNTGTDPNVMFQTGRVLQGTGPRVIAYWAAGWQTFTNDAQLLPGNVTFDLDTGPNQVHIVVAGATVYVPIAPTSPVVAAADQSATEGEPISLASVSFVDQEVSQTHRAIIDWGDGSALEVGGVNQTDGLAGIVTGTHVYTDEGDFTVAVCVSDDGNPDAEGCDTLQMTVVNVAPQVTILGVPESGEEGSVVTLSSLVTDVDPVALSWTVAYDGAVLATGTHSDFSFTPVDEAVYDVSLTADDGDGGMTTATGQVTVNNVAPDVTITGVPGAAVEDEQVTLNSIVGDPGSADLHTYTWTAAHHGVTVATSAETVCSFTPELTGAYLVTLVVNDGDGGITSTQIQFQVTATPTPEPAPEPEPVPAPELTPAPQPEPEPAPEPAPAPKPTPEPKPTKKEASDNNWVPPRREAWSQHILGLPTIHRVVSDPVIEPASMTAGSKGTDPVTDPKPMPSIVEHAEAAPETTMDVPATGLLLALLGVGPILFLVTRTWLRRRAGVGSGGD
jgi:hypothetical protein